MSSLALETVELKVADGVAWIRLNRPESLNAWVPQFGRDLIAALDDCANNPQARCVVITGAGKAFSSGADLRQGGIFDDQGRADVLTPLRNHYNPVILKVRELPKPVITAVNGVAAGIGCSLAIAADFVVCAESAYFLLAFANVGLAVDGGCSPLLIGRIGFTRAAEMALLASRVPAATALQWGLINEVTADDALISWVAELAAKLASGATGAYAAIKRTLNLAAYPNLAELLDLEAVLQQERAESADFIEGATAFLQKRKPEFSGN